jgi:hypothetical protein
MCFNKHLSVTKRCACKLAVVSTVSEPYMYLVTVVQQEPVCGVLSNSARSVFWHNHGSQQYKQEVTRSTAKSQFVGVRHEGMQAPSSTALQVAALLLQGPHPSITCCCVCSAAGLPPPGLSLAWQPAAAGY